MSSPLGADLSERDDVRVIALTDNDSSNGPHFLWLHRYTAARDEFRKLRLRHRSKYFLCRHSTAAHGPGSTWKKIVDGNLLVDPGYYTLPLPKDVTQEPLAGMIYGAYPTCWH